MYFIAVDCPVVKGKALAGHTLAEALLEVFFILALTISES